MFGHVEANLADLSEEEQKRYRAAYCGLCHTLGKRHGFLARFTLTYDLTFLALLLSSLYEPEEVCGSCRCMAKPCKKHGYMVSACTEYASDMTIALTYYKCLDDWVDDKNILAWLVAKLLEKKYRKVKKLWPTQCAVIEQEIKTISEIEVAEDPQPDSAANSFGMLMAGLFAYGEELWQAPLKRLGYGLGRYIYYADAAVDYKRDVRKGSYNPLVKLQLQPEQMQPMLKLLLGEASESFEFLPLVQDVHLLRNILYSGIWQKYNQGMRRKREKNGR